MAARVTPSFAPIPDEYTAFVYGPDEEQDQQEEDGDGASWAAPLRNAAKYLTQTLTAQHRMNERDIIMGEPQFHNLMVTSLVGPEVGLQSVPDILLQRKESISNQLGGERVEEYITAYLPTHLIRANMLADAGDVLSDSDFIGRRVASLGPIESARRQVADLLDLKRELARLLSNIDSGQIAPAIPAENGNISSSNNSAKNSTTNGATQQGAGTAQADNPNLRIDINNVLREGSRGIIDEVYRVVDLSSSSEDSLNMAICLSSVGEGLLKSRQPRDAMLRLEEAVGIYRGLLGPYHVDVARALNSVAKALAKLGETRVALLKFKEASRIFESCNATRHYDAIANAQSMASLLVDIGEWSKAEAKYEEVISLRKSVYGQFSLLAAKTINDYAIVLAKHGKMDDALRQYEEARMTYERVAAPSVSPDSVASVNSVDVLAKCSLDICLINLNIASIKSKKGDLPGAIAAYEEGVRGIRGYEQGYRNRLGEPSDKMASHRRHLVSALGRIGSLKLKCGDNNGSLEAYAQLLKEVDNESPTSSQMEKAKAHIKCATIHRQGSSERDKRNAIKHLQEALTMYTYLYGENHRDTMAVSSSLRQWRAEEESASRDNF